MEENGFGPPPTPTDDPYEFMRIVLNPDGTLTRTTFVAIAPPVSQSDSPAAACFSKDVVYDRRHGLRLRLYRPAAAAVKLPILFYVHGGGFILLGPDAAPFHAANERRACDLPALVIAVGYRLAPEHRLPAAYDDVIAAVEWVRDDWAGEPWLRDFGDPSRCFLMGSSAGGNIALQAALRAAEMDLASLRVVGVILNQPFFGGERRTEAEIKREKDPMLPLMATDVMWELALPAGASRDHEFSNPAVAEEKIRWLSARWMVNCYGGDPLVERQREVAKKLEEGGAEVAVRFHEGGFHGADFFDPQMQEDLLIDIKSFL